MTDNQSPGHGSAQGDTPSSMRRPSMDLWNIDGLGATDFNLMGVPDDAYSFLPNDTLSPMAAQSLSVLQAPPQAQGQQGQHQQQQQQQHSQHSQQQHQHQQQPPLSKENTNSMLNHYQFLLNQNKVSMKEAFSAGANTTAGTTSGTTTGSTTGSNTAATTNRNSAYLSPQGPVPTAGSPQNNLGSYQAEPAKSCDHCRRRQTKCVQIPNLLHCIQCETKGIKCTFSENLANPMLKRNMGVIQEDSTSAGQKKQKLTTPTPIPQHQNFKKPQQPATIQYPRSSFLVGSTSMFDASLLDRIKLDKIDQAQLTPSLSLRKVSNDVLFILRNDYTEELASNADRTVDQVENLVAPFGQQLVNVYFRVVHPSFPILHRKVFLEKYARSYREFAAPLLGAVYSLACQWWDQDPILSKNPKPNVELLNELAFKSFLDVIERPRLSAVQAGLLLLHCRSENPNNWILCQQVVALSEELGLGIDCQNWKLPKWERGLRRRLAWAVWIQEKWVSLNESRVSHYLIGRNWLVRNIGNDDFPELPLKNPRQDELEYKDTINDIDNGKFLFKEMIELSLILSEIMETFYTYNGNNSPSIPIEQVLKLAKPLQLKLRQWYHTLPQSLQMNSTRSSKLCPFGSLHLSYFAAEITLHRKIIISLNGDVHQELVKVCRAAATTRLVAVLEFVRNLKNEHIFAYWHSSTTNNFTLVGTFAAILFVTSTNANEANIYKEHIATYRSHLLKLSKNFVHALNALKRIDMLLYQIPGLLTDNVLPIQNDILSPANSISSPMNFQQGLSPHLGLSPYLGQSGFQQQGFQAPQQHQQQQQQQQHQPQQQQQPQQLKGTQSQPQPQPTAPPQKQPKQPKQKQPKQPRRSVGGPPVTTIKSRTSSSDLNKTSTQSPLSMATPSELMQHSGTNTPNTKSANNSPTETRK